MRTAPGASKLESRRLRPSLPEYKASMLALHRAILFREQPFGFCHVINDVINTALLPVAIKACHRDTMREHEQLHDRGRLARYCSVQNSPRVFDR